MSDVTNDLMYEVLKDIRGTLNKHTEHFQRIEQRLGAIEHHVAGFHLISSIHHQDEMSDIKLKLEQVEKRLELRD